MKLSEMNKNEKSLLLFFESACVEFGGKLDTRHMNKEDQAIKDKWIKLKFIQYGRIKFSDIEKLNSNKTIWVKLSDEAWKLAHEERISRFKRLEYNRI